ncbi:ALDH-like protein [Armillaria gallica]|uniref:ALDH-like protein n=1 Tax=Armillaria gallica TaxID=47427 RepID=A0A2H3DH17_ARMGA|nr:ALDH-like protein [Armillaria gallica]
MTSQIFTYNFDTPTFKGTTNIDGWYARRLILTILEPSEITPLTAQRFCDFIIEAGFPPDVVNIINGYGHTVGQVISEHPDNSKVAFTGSTLVGKKIQEASAKSNLKAGMDLKSYRYNSTCRVMSYLHSAREDGAQFHVGGEKHENAKKGYFIQPTVFTGENSMRSVQEEIFRPVAALIKFKTEEEAIALANDSSYGLVAAVFSESSSTGDTRVGGWSCLC